MTYCSSALASRAPPSRRGLPSRVGKCCWSTETRFPATRYPPTPSPSTRSTRSAAALRSLFEQTVGAAAARDDSACQLNPLRAVLLNQHDARRVIRALPGLLDQMFEPMERFRHVFIANLYDAEVEVQPG
jgi:hypothetical protein